MKKYVGTKIIEAEPMNLGDYNNYRKWSMPTNENPKKEGYHVVYPDGYQSWSPKEIFEESYHEFLPKERFLDDAVFPSEDVSIASANDPIYGGAHRYQFKNSIGFNKGKAEYVESRQEIQFVQKNDDGTVTPGLQNEQLVIALIDRTRKLNNRFPSAQSEKMFEGLEMYLQACVDRVHERIERGIMGDLKK